MRQKLIEAFMVILLIIIISAGAIVGMYSQRASIHLHKREEGIKEVSSLSAEHEVLMRTYMSCWSDVRFSVHQPCALDVVDLARTQGRLDAEIADILGVLGIFENGCVEPYAQNVRTVDQTPELKKLMGLWCSSRTVGVTDGSQQPL